MRNMEAESAVNEMILGFRNNERKLERVSDVGYVLNSSRPAWFRPNLELMKVGESFEVSPVFEKKAYSSVYAFMCKSKREFKVTKHLNNTVFTRVE